MKKYSATFSTGETITRKSEREYHYAWATIRISTGRIENKGFSNKLPKRPKLLGCMRWEKYDPPEWIAKAKANEADHRYEVVEVTASEV